MRAIDAHQHFWQYHPEKHSWINDAMNVIRKDFLPADLEPVLRQNQVSGCVAVQADQTEAETDFLVALANEHPFIKAVVGWVDLSSDNIQERLAYYQQQHIIKGFRHILQGEEPSFMLQPAFLHGISLLQSFGFTYDVLIYPKHLAATLKLVKQFPNQLFVIDHIAKPDIKNGSITEWKAGMEALAEYPNVSCKISGMVTEADWKNWKKQDLFPYLDAVTNAFGTKRLMYGSDWPVCLVAASYAEMVSPVREYYARFSAAEQEAVFAGNAINFYHL
ncbi:MAG: amidohydrolase family protein [Bacteroidota bacterium]